jgi:hypothetical protein
LKEDKKLKWFRNEVARRENIGPKKNGMYRQFRL